MQTNEETCGDLGRLKTMLMIKATLVWNFLASNQIFMMHKQYPEEKFQTLQRSSKNCLRMPTPVMITHLLYCYSGS